MSSRTHNWNGFETTLTAQLTAGATSAQLASTAGLAAPCYLLVEPGTPGNREWIRVNTIVDGNNISGIVRNQAGSVGDITHASTSIVRGVFTKQQLDAIFTDIEGAETTSNNNSSALTDQTTPADQHPEYITVGGSRNFTGTVGGVSGVATTDFVTKAQVDAADAANAADITQEASDRATADNAHANSNDHPSATTGAKGMMSSTDKAKLDGIEANAKDDQTITAGTGLTGGGTGDVSIAHADTTTHGSVNNNGNTVIQDLYIDNFGHATDINSVTITPSLIGAEPAVTDADIYVIGSARKATGIALTAGFYSLADTWNFDGVPASWNGWQCVARATVCLAGAPAGLHIQGYLQIGANTFNMGDPGPNFLGDVKDAGEEVHLTLTHSEIYADLQNRITMQCYLQDASGSGGGVPRYIAWDFMAYRRS